MWYKYTFSNFTTIACGRFICHCDWDLSSFTLPQRYWLDVTAMYCVTLKIRAGSNAASSIYNKKWNMTCHYLYPSNQGCFAVISTVAFLEQQQCIFSNNNKLQKSSSSVQVFTAFCLSPDLHGASLHNGQVTFPARTFLECPAEALNAPASLDHIMLPLLSPSCSSTVLCCLV